MDPFNLSLRIFLFPAFRSVPIPRLRDVLGSDLSLHGTRCSWLVARELCRGLEETRSGFLVAGIADSFWYEIGEEDLLGALLQIPVAWMPFSVRARNCFQDSKISTIADLIGASPEHLLAKKNLGRKTLNEILEAVQSLGFKPQTSVVKTAEIRAVLGRPTAAFRELDLRCLASLAALGGQCVSARLSGVSLLGQLMATSDSILQRQLSPKEYDRAQEMVKLVDPGARNPVIDWSPPDLHELASIFHEEIQTWTQTFVCPIDRDLLSRFSGLSDRKNGIVRRFFALDGDPVETLEAIGQRFGVSRERIRQVAEQGESLIKSRPAPAALSSITNFIRSRVPGRAIPIERELIDQGLCSTPLRLDAILRISEVFGGTPDFVVRQVGQERYAVAAAIEQDVLESVLREARRRIAHFGITNVHFISRELSKPESFIHPEIIRSLVPVLDDHNWLDSDHVWFWSPSVTRNSVLSRARKAIWVGRAVSAEELRDAILRDPRMTEVDLPLDVFRMWCATVPGFYIAHDGMICPSADWTDAPPLTEAEAHVAERLSAVERPVHLAELRDICREVGDYSDAGIHRTAFASPILKALGGGFYGLVGSHFDIASTEHLDLAEVLGQQVGNEGEDDPQEVPSSSKTDLEPGFICDLAPTSADFCRDAAVRILRRAAQLGLTTANGPSWSLVELDWSASDMDTLKGWAEMGEEPRRGLWLEGVLNPEESIALIFLAFCTYVGRTFAAEGELWSHVAERCGSQIRAAMFYGRAVPKQWLHEATQDLCRKARLRNVFGQDGAYSWLRTVYLQFGISSAGMTRLPRFLSSGRLPITVSDLLGTTDLGSNSFRRGWLAIGEFNSSIRSAKDTQSALRSNAWFKNEADRIIAALEHTAETHNGDVDTTIEDQVDVRMSWNDVDPHATLSLGHTWPPEFTADAYVVEVGSSLRTVVSKDESGRYSTLRNFRIPLESTENALSILDSRGEILFRTTITILDRDEEIVAFRRSTGSRIDIWSLQPAEPVLIAARSDLHPSIPAHRFRRILSGIWTLHDYPEGCPSGLELLLDGQLFWRISELDETAKSAPHEHFRVIAQGGRFGEPVLLDIPRDLQKNTVALDLDGQVVRSRSGSFSLVLDPSYQSRKHVCLVTQDGSNRLRRLRAEFLVKGDLWGVALKTGQRSWHNIRAKDAVQADTFSGSKLMVLPPSYWRGEVTRTEEWALMEGSNFLARPRKTPLTGIGSMISGFGEEMEIVRGPYNSGDNIRICRSVMDSGIVEDVRRDTERWSLTLRHDLQLGPDHEIWCWDDSKHEPCRVPFTQLSGRAISPVGPANAKAFALTFRNQWLGSRLVQESSLLEILQALTVQGWRRGCAWLRWWRMPLLRSDAKYLIKRLVESDPVFTFQCWAFAKDHDGMPFPEDSGFSNGWSSVVRHFYWEWLPTPGEAAHLLKEGGLLTGEPAIDIIHGWTGAEQLCLLHPVLLVSLACGGVGELYRAVTLNEQKILIGMLANVIAGIPRNSGSSSHIKESLLRDSALQMGVDPVFVKRVLLREARSLLTGENQSTKNLKVALNVQPFRRWIVLELLSEVMAC